MSKPRPWRYLPQNDGELTGVCPICGEIHFDLIGDGSVREYTCLNPDASDHPDAPTSADDALLFVNDTIPTADDADANLSRARILARRDGWDDVPLDALAAFCAWVVAQRPALADADAAAWRCWLDAGELAGLALRAATGCSTGEELSAAMRDGELSGGLLPEILDAAIFENWTSNVEFKNTMSDI